MNSIENKKEKEILKAKEYNVIKLKGFYGIIFYKIRKI